MQHPAKTITTVAKAAVISFILTSFSIAAFADGEGGAETPAAAGYGAQNGPPLTGQSEHSEQVEKALAICQASVDRDANGYPNHKALSDCMSKKGFNKPARKAPPAATGQNSVSEPLPEPNLGANSLSQ